MSNETRSFEDWRDVRLVCGIGHHYRGKTRKTQRKYYDMDGDPMWSEPFDAFDPDTCVVCGLKTWSIEPFSAPSA